MSGAVAPFVTPQYFTCIRLKNYYPALHQTAKLVVIISLIEVIIPMWYWDSKSKNTFKNLVESMPKRVTKFLSFYDRSGIIGYLNLLYL